MPTGRDMGARGWGARVGLVRELPPLLVQCNELLRKRQPKSRQRVELSSVAAVRACKSAQYINPLPHSPPQSCIGAVQNLLERTVASGELQDVADSSALCELLELSGRLSSRRDARWLVPVRRELVDALVQMEDTLTHADIAMTGRVSSLPPAIRSRDR